MNKSIKRVISTILAAAVAASPLFGSYTNAESSENAVSKIDTASEAISSVLSEKDIPECLALEVSKNNKFAARLYDKETALDTVLFANKDGSETVYIFNEDVKYIDENGMIADKSNKLYSNIKERAFSSDYSYVNKENDINTYFPKSLKTDVGVSVEAQGQVIEMYPLSDVVSNVTADDDMYGVYYDDVFGEFTGIRYEPNFSGYKEDIILEKNVGNKFGFILETGDLTPVLENGVIYIRDEDGEDFGMISPVYVYDSFVGNASTEEERHFTYDNRFELNPISGGKYELVVVVDEQFLDNPATVYPVIVDPSVTINSTGSGSSKAILDTPVYNGSGYVGTAGANSTAVIGYVSSSYGVGRLLMRFPGLMSKYYFMNSDYRITSATLTINECSGGSAFSNISAYNYTGPDWDESTVYNSDVYNGVGYSISSWTFSYPNYITYAYDITSAVKSWQTNPSQGNKGIIFKNTTSESDYSKTKVFYTTEGAVKPYLSITYEAENISFANAKEISLNTTVNVNVETSNRKRYYTFVAPTSGYYSIESSSNGSYDPYGWLYDSGKSQIDYSDDHGGNHNFHIIRRLTGGQRYYVAAGCFGSKTGVYTLRIVARTPASSAYESAGGLSSRTVTIQLIGSTTTSSAWQPIINSAKNAWQSSRAGTNITLTTSSSPHTLEVAAYTWKERGKATRWYGDDLIATSSTIEINTRSLSGVSTNAKQSTIAHEIGHLLWLDDNPHTTESSLMSYYRNRETVVGPQFIDVYHVLNNYS